MRDNSEGMVEIVRSYEYAGAWHGLVRVTINGERRSLDWPLNPPARSGFSHILNLRPFDDLPGAPHRFFFAASVRKLPGTDLAEVGIRVEVNGKGKQIPVEVPLEFAANLVWLSQARAWSEVSQLKVVDAV